MVRADTDMVRDDDLPADLSQAARNAFALAGYTRLEQFTAVSVGDALALHGVGAKGIAMIARDLGLRGKSFADRADDLPADLPDATRQALFAAGYTRLAQFAGVAETEIAQLAGIGPKTTQKIARDLKLRKLAFAGA